MFCHNILLMGNQHPSAASNEEDESSLITPSLHANLLRTRNRCNPYDLLDVLEILGEGSMGHVVRVRKRDTGGSARPKGQRRPFCRNIGVCWGGDDGSINKSMNALVVDDTPDIDTAPSTLSTSSTSSMIAFNNSKNPKDMVFALKSIHLDRCSSATFRQELEREVAILKSLDHPNIVRCWETYHHQRRLYLLLEDCVAGDLYARDPYTESQARTIVHQLLRAVHYLHTHRVVHRDLKFENVMFVQKGSYAIKLIDFGLSQKFAANEHLHETVGTVYTMAPELIRGKYDAKVDVWSVGVIAYMLLSSSMPFYGRSREAVIQQIIQHDNITASNGSASSNYLFHGRRWDKVSKEAQEFVERLLNPDPRRRPSAGQVLHGRDGSSGRADPWLTEEAPSLTTPEQVAKTHQMDSVQISIEAFATYSPLKQLALLVIAYKSTVDDIGFLRNVFEEFDSVEDGVITHAEFAACLRNRYRYTDTEVRHLFEKVDVDGTGSIQYNEFLAATLEAHGSIDEERLAEAFDRLDADDTGYISFANLRGLLGPETSRRYLDRLLDDNRNAHNHQSISYSEFLAMWDARNDAKFADLKTRVQSKRLQHDVVAQAPGNRDEPTRNASFDRQKRQSLRVAASHLSAVV